VLDDFPRMTQRECHCNYASLENYKATSTSLEKDDTTSVNNCKCLHLDAEKVTEICHLP
jgi:hypothetical protein